MKKIIVISNMYPSKTDPVYGTFVKGFVDGLAEASPCWSIEKVVIAGRSRNIYEKVFKYIIFYFTIIFRLLFYRYEFVYVHLITHAALPLRFVSLFRSLKLVFNVHGEDLLTQSRLAAFFLKMVIPLLKKASLIVLPSRYFQRRFERLLPMISVDKLYVSPSGGIDLNLFKPSILEKNLFTIGYVSRIERGKGWDIFLDSIYMLNNKGIKIQALIVGHGDEVGRFHKRIEDLGLSNIIFLGAVPHELLSSVYSQMDLFVFPTQLEESLGLVGLEAMACGVPVIGSCIGGLTDYIEEGTNGFFFEPGNVQSLVDSILKYIECDDLMKCQLKKNAIDTAQSFSKDQTFNELYRRLDMI